MRQASKRVPDSAEKTVRDIRRATRRHHSAEEKIRIVLEGLRGEDSIAELCRKEGINQNLYYRWSKEFLEAGKKRLAGDTAREATLPRAAQTTGVCPPGVPSIVVYAAGEPKRLEVSGAALAVGAAPSPGEDQAAKSFFADLLRRGRLKVAKPGKPRAEIVRSSAASTHETHTHELRRDGGQMVLRRDRIDCGHAHH